MRVSQPTLPAGYVPAGTVTSLMSWDVVSGAMKSSLHYWLATTGPDQAPHVVPRWGVWLDDTLLYDGSPETKHVRNLASNSSCALHLESGTDVVIAYGLSRPSQPVSGELGVRLSAEFVRKYAALGYSPSPDSWADSGAGGLVEFKPSVVMAWSEFPVNLTKFDFEE